MIADFVLLPWHVAGASTLIALGLFLAARGVRRCYLAFPRPHASMQPLGWMRGFRLTLIGLAVAGIGAAWLWQMPWLLALSLAIGGEEALESSIAIHALRGQQQHEQAQPPHSAPSLRAESPAPATR
ncbi:MAG: hypothetical protein AB7R89_05695 [Dehalococcoidia bacterium]